MALDKATGDLKWEGGTFSDSGSCIMTTDNRIIVWGGRGRLALVDPAVGVAEVKDAP